MEIFVSKFTNIKTNKKHNPEIIVNKYVRSLLKGEINATNVIKQNNPSTICDTNDNKQNIVNKNVVINETFFYKYI